MAKSYYTILEVTDGAKAEEIRSSYRRLVKKYHPDHCGGDGDAFCEIQQAYDVLGDDRRRRQYDQRRAPTPAQQPVGRHEGPAPEPLIPDDAPPFSDDISLTGSFDRAAPSFDEIFDCFWRNFSGRGSPKSRRIERLVLEVPISLAQARCGGTARVMVPARTDCPACRGIGRPGGYRCPGCGGAGAILGEVPVAVAFPPMPGGDHAVVVPLERLGIHNLHLTVLFRTSGR